MPVPAGESGGGVAHAIVGTLLIVGTASLIGLPVGIAAGIFATEWQGTRLAVATRFIADVLNGTPSIVVGVFAWTWIVARQGHFSGFAGSVALAVLMIPMVMRTTEEMIKLVPNSLREAALALGFPRWRTSLGVVVRTCLPGIVTGSLLAVARAETGGCDGGGCCSASARCTWRAASSLPGAASADSSSAAKPRASARLPEPGGPTSR